MTVYESNRIYYRTVPETVSHFVVPSFPPSAQINPTMLLHLDGPNASQVFTDATGRHALTGSGCAIDTSISKFGGASCVFVTSQHITGDGNADLLIALNDFTIDFWVNRSSFAFNATLFATDLIINPDALAIEWNSTGTFDVHTGGGGQVIVGTTVFNTTGVWLHAAVTRKAGTMRLFVNGSQEGSNYDASAFSVGLAATGPSIGATQGNSAGLAGNIDEFRLINGVAAWVTGFTPPTVPYMVS